jgi:microcin C transport system substrate-binding protein
MPNAMTRALLAALFLPWTAALAQETIQSHGISAFGELKYAPDFQHFDYVNPEAPQGGTMSFRGVLASQTFDSLNNFILAGEPAQGLELIYDSLLAPSHDEPDSAYGLIAESLEYPETREWVIFNLRPEARFSDGEAVTAEDVVWTLEALQTMGSPYWRITLDDVESAEALGEHRVRFDFVDGAATRDLPKLVGELSILPKHYYEEVAFDRSTLEPPVGSGRYVIDDVSPGQSIRYCRNPDYWGEGLPVNVGSFNFECYVYRYFGDNTAAFEALKVGDYLFHEEYTSAIWATGYDFPAIDRGWVKREILPDERSSGAQGFWLNLRREKLRDIRVRRAIGLMFNFEWTNETLFYGLYERTDSFWENTSMQASGPLTGDELATLEPHRDQLLPEVFDQTAYTPPVNSADQQTDRAAIREASRLLEDAGWVVGDDGLRRNADGEVLTLEMIDDSPALERIALPFISNLRRIGVDARFERIDSAQMQERQENFDYDITIGRIVLPLSPSVELRSVFGSAGRDAPGTLNLSGVADPVVDALIEEIISAESREALETRVRALDRVLRSKHIWVPNWYKGEHWIAHWDVFGRPETKPPYDRGDEFWWWDEEKYQALRDNGALR